MSFSERALEPDGPAETDTIAPASLGFNEENVVAAKGKNVPTSSAGAGAYRF